MKKDFESHYQRLVQEKERKDRLRDLKKELAPKPVSKIQKKYKKKNPLSWMKEEIYDRYEYYLDKEE